MLHIPSQLRLVQSCPRSKKFEETFKQEYEVYKKYQMIIHKDDESKPTEKQFTGFLIDSPLEVGICEFCLKHFALGLFRYVHRFRAAIQHRMAASFTLQEDEFVLSGGRLKKSIIGTGLIIVGGLQFVPSNKANIAQHGSQPVPVRSKAP